ncbi:hypothetical protein LCGC14_1422230 [marine sediment metagenome]|uniref:Uncharacterized protein n=1 Tax=marine sediment metagenome TaxID=412755 RepID=A0A0F9M6L8_9ZZZZ
MNYERDWNNQLNAARFAVECARLALPFYNGDRRSDVAAAIEIAERRANGEQIDSTIAYAVFARATRAAYAATAAYAAADAARVASATAWAAAHATNSPYTDDSAAAYVTYAAADASHAGVDSSEIQIAFARWVIRDLSRGRDLDEELRAAAGAAVVAGDEDLARQLLEYSRRRSVHR